MTRKLLILSALFGMLGVILGAFGAHGLKDQISESMMANYQTGVQYHMIHALALLGTALASARLRQNTVVLAGWFFVAGIIIFSGSLYIMALTGMKWLGAITPIGGVALIVGWLLLLIGAWAWKPQQNQS
ncbi:MAG TPA: DUF423 domain-containing protein [Phycisphaerales bacterium]|nr:DUF423 domain-containing protein [Phycisphaerales bacterium]|tara:strand:- start:13323 stop:13712 length:390 start_codon:yes stop_codon:yes gene_type:complete